MISGEIKINGSVGDFLEPMSGGEIYVKGNAGNFVGSSYLGVARNERGKLLLTETLKITWGVL